MPAILRRGGRTGENGIGLGIGKSQDQALLCPLSSRSGREDGSEQYKPREHDGRFTHLYAFLAASQVRRLVSRCPAAGAGAGDLCLSSEFREPCIQAGMRDLKHKVADKALSLKESPEEAASTRSRCVSSQQRRSMRARLPSTSANWWPLQCKRQLQGCFNIISGMLPIAMAMSHLRLLTKARRDNTSSPWKSRRRPRLRSVSGRGFARTQIEIAHALC